MKEWLMQYLVFTRKERMGLVVLLSLIGAVWLLPYFFGRGKNRDRDLLAKADSVIKGSDSTSQNGSLKIFTHFPFDPNTLDEEGWEKLGIRPKTIATIKNYLAKGGRFRQPSDLTRIYGLRPDESLRLMPYVVISPGKNEGRHSGNSDYPKRWPDKGREVSAEYRPSRYRELYTLSREGGARDGEPFPRPANRQGSFYTDRYSKFHGPFKNKKPVEPFDINLADTSILIALPGIGSRLALRIVQFREKLGGFYSIDQLGEVYGLQDSVLTLISPFLVLNHAQLRKIMLNSAGFDTLNAHPYIQFSEARAIVQYRKQHGSFESMDDLLKISILNREWLDKVGPYLDIGQH